MQLGQGSPVNQRVPTGPSPDCALGGRAAPWHVPALCFLAIVADGFDTAAIGLVVPALVAQWGVVPARFTAAFVATSLGAVLGYLMSGPASARWGARRVLLTAVTWFGLGSAATVLAGSPLQLAALRLITGLGLGAAMPAAIGIAVGALAPRQREAGAVLIGSGMSVGALLAGLLGSRLIAAGGWIAPFAFGAALPLLLWPVLAWTLPRDEPSALGARAGAPPAAALGALLAGGRLGATLLLWLFSFASFAALYLLVYWLPTLLVALGQAASEALAGAAWFGGGGVLGALALAVAAGRVGVARCLTAGATGGTIMLALLMLAPDGGNVGGDGVVMLVVVAGACLAACAVGQSGIAVALYPGPLRVAGIGCAAAAGRIGSIVGPACAGALLAFAGEPRAALIGAIAPMGVAALAALALAVRSSRWTNLTPDRARVRPPGR
jgi:MFS transporter, AAHS family, 4-hydroxybenzoate transporter